MRGLSTLVRVIKPGVFNGPDHRALPYAEAGEVVEVAGGGYGDSLIADGWVTDELSLHIPEPDTADEVGSRANQNGEGDSDPSVRQEANAEMRALATSAADEVGSRANQNDDDALAAEVMASAVALGQEGVGSRANQTEPDDLSRIKGIGPKTVGHFVEHGWATFAQLALADVDEVASAAKTKKATAQVWIDEARELAG